MSGYKAVGYYYLAGPMRGLPEFNMPAFRIAAKYLRSLGVDIVSPAEMDEAEGFTWHGYTGHENLAEQGFNLAERLTADIKAVADPRCNGVIVLPGWENSTGARAEVSFARALGKEILRFNGINEKPVLDAVVLTGVSYYIDTDEKEVAHA